MVQRRYRLFLPRKLDQVQESGNKERSVIASTRPELLGHVRSPRRWKLEIVGGPILQRESRTDPLLLCRQPKPWDDELEKRCEKPGLVDSGSMQRERSGAENSHEIGQPSVFKYGTKYYMAYHKFCDLEHIYTALASSPDGVHWTDSGLLLTGDIGKWDAAQVHFPFAASS